MSNKDQPGMSELNIEGYGGDDPDLKVPDQATTGNKRESTAYGDRTDGGFTGGSDFGTGAAEAAGRGGDTDSRQQAYNEGYEDTTANAGAGELGGGEQFGEWGDSGVGTDLTSRMELPRDAGTTDRSSGSSGSSGSYSSGTSGSTGGSSSGTTEIPDEASSIDPKTGLVKGGQAGTEEVAGPGQYGG